MAPVRVGENADLIARIENDFAFHPATTKEKTAEHGSIRVACRDLALFIVDNTPRGREQSLALTHLEETMHWANSALAKGNTNVTHS